MSVLPSSDEREVIRALFDVLYVLQLEPEVRLEYVSASVEDFTGYSAEEYLADPGLWLRVLDARDHDLLLSGFNAAPGVATHLTLRWTAKDGRAVWSRQNGRKVVRPDGSVALYGALNHISPQQIAEVQAGLDGRYRMLAEDASDVVFQTDHSGRIRWVSESMAGVAGWQPSELVGTVAQDLVDPQDRPLSASIEPRILAGETRSGVVLRIRTAGGGQRFVSATARPARDEQSGEVIGAIVAWRDVHDLVRAQLAAESEREILRASLDAQLDPQVILEAVREPGGDIVDFRCVEINRAGCQILGRPRSDLVGATALEVDPRLTGSLLMRRFVTVVTEREPLVLNDFPFPSADAPRVHVDVRAVPVHDGMSLTWRDVTQRYRTAAALAQSEARYRLLLEESSDLVTFHTPRGEVQWVSPAIRRILGWAPEEVAGRVMGLIHRDDAAGIGAVRDAILAGEESGSVRFRMRDTDGQWRWLEATARAVRDDDGTIDSLVVFSHDIQAQMDYERALAESEERYRLLAENATDVVYRTSLDGVTEWVSEGVTKVLGFTPDEFIGRNGRDLVCPEDREFVGRATAEVLAGQRQTARFRMPAKSGGKRWIEATIHPVHDEAGEVVGFVGGWRDVQTEVEAAQVLDQRARTDDLTGLLNRREAIALLEQWLSPDNAHRAELAVAFCDLDDFKSVNDTLGHAVGDRVLQVVAERIQGCLRTVDTIARVGGDEILLLLRGVRSVDAATAVAQKVRAAVAAPIDVEGTLVTTTVSIGVTMADEHDDVDVLVARADRAMYMAKDAGRDQVVSLG